MKKKYIQTSLSIYLLFLERAKTQFFNQYLLLRRKDFISDKFNTANNVALNNAFSAKTKSLQSCTPKAFHLFFLKNYFSSSSSFFSSSLSGKIIDKRTDITNTPPTIPNETGEGI